MFCCSFCLGSIYCIAPFHGITIVCFTFRCYYCCCYCYCYYSIAKGAIASMFSDSSAQPQFRQSETLKWVFLSARKHSSGIFSCCFFSLLLLLIGSAMIEWRFLLPIKIPIGLDISLNQQHTTNLLCSIQF